MTECKHGLRTGCSYCHVKRPIPAPPVAQKKRGRASPLSEKMNDRVTALKRRLKEIRGE